MRLSSALLFLGIPIQAMQRTEQPSYIRLAQSMRHQITAQLNEHRMLKEEERIAFEKQLKFIRSHLHNQLLVAKHEHKQFCKQISEEKKKISSALNKVS